MSAANADVTLQSTQLLSNLEIYGYVYIDVDGVLTQRP
jgi:hypothetical protein